MADISQEAAAIELDHVAILRDCYLTANHYDNVRRRLQGLITSVKQLRGRASDLVQIIPEMYHVARCLTQLADVAQLHSGQIQVVLLNLNFILPRLAKLLLTIESPLDGLIRGQQNFRSDCNVRRMQETVLEIIRQQAGQGIGHNNPIHTGAIVDVDTNPHWARMVFTKSLLQPVFKGDTVTEDCQSLGPHLELGEHRIPINSKIYIGLYVLIVDYTMDPLSPFPFVRHYRPDFVGVPRRRNLNHNTMSCIIFENSESKQAYILLRVFRDDKPQFALEATHELHVKRVGSSLHLAKHDANEGTFAPWAVLSNLNWESLVLMYCTFLSLKASNTPTRQFCTEELCLQGEQKEFQATIRGSGFHQTLEVCREESSGNVRLHAVVQEGLLRQCPVWTIFVPDADSCVKAVASMDVDSSADTDEGPLSPPHSHWLTRVSSVKFYLARVQVHVFSQHYDAQAQRKGPKGEFELEFISEADTG
ncbi:hypothetical protein E4U33_003256 [Claviceps sp. LM78 group G4]|nr:hypothetical protein E4U33_003256 [Claviceps sp. LM78 group G4]